MEPVIFSGEVEDTELEVGGAAVESVAEEEVVEPDGFGWVGGFREAGSLVEPAGLPAGEGATGVVPVELEVAAIVSVVSVSVIATTWLSLVILKFLDSGK